MSDYTAIGNAIKTTFLADAWLGSSANVKKIEVYKRGFEAQGQERSRYFSENDLPAIAITPSAGAKASEQTTTNEIISIVKPQVIAIARGRDAQTADETIHALAANIERVLEKQKSSAQDLGIDAYVSNVASTFEEYKDGEYYLMISVTTCDVEITTLF